MKTGDIVRYRKPVTGKHEWIGLVIDVDEGWLWAKVHWHDGLQRWDGFDSLEVANEDR